MRFYIFLLVSILFGGCRTMDRNQSAELASDSLSEEQLKAIPKHECETTYQKSDARSEDSAVSELIVQLDADTFAARVAAYERLKKRLLTNNQDGVVRSMINEALENVSTSLEVRKSLGNLIETCEQEAIRMLPECREDEVIVSSLLVDPYYTSTVTSSITEEEVRAGYHPEMKSDTFYVAESYWLSAVAGKASCEEVLVEVKRQYQAKIDTNEQTIYSLSLEEALNPKRCCHLQNTVYSPFMEGRLFAPINKEQFESHCSRNFDGKVISVSTLPFKVERTDESSSGKYISHRAFRYDERGGFKEAIICMSAPSPV